MRGNMTMEARRSESERDLKMLCFEKEGRGHKLMQVTSRSWKRQGDGTLT